MNELQHNNIRCTEGRNKMNPLQFIIRNRLRTAANPEGEQAPKTPKSRL